MQQHHSKLKARFYTKKSSLQIPWTQLIAITAFICLQFLHPTIRNLTYLVLTLWALRSPKHAIQALTLSFLLHSLNPSIFPQQEFSLLAWLVLFSAFFRVSFSYIKQNTNRKSYYFVAALLVFTLPIIYTSLFHSSFVLVSILKLVSFFIGSSTVILAFELTRAQYKYWEKWFSALFIVIVIGSFPLYFHSLGYVINTVGFQGLLNHPQLYGVFLVPMLAWFTGRFIFNKDYSFIVILGLIVGFISLFATLCRTAVLALILGLLLSLLIAIMYKKSWRWMIICLLKSLWTWFLGGLIIILLSLNWNMIVDKSTHFLNKGTREATMYTRYSVSRGALIQLSWDNFLSNPLLGIGFGIASNRLDFKIQFDETLGIPISASIEKGLIFTQVLEEIGIVGFILWLILLTVLIRPLLRINNFVPLWIFLVCLLTNFGEATFFSMGGVGLYIWLLFGFSRIMRF